MSSENPSKQQDKRSGKTTDDLKREIISRLDIASFYAKYAPEAANLTGDSSGWTKRIKCPLHEEANPSFAFNVTTGGFKCFSHCGGGSIFDFWMLKNGYSIDDRQKFLEALVALANEAGVNVSDWNNLGAAKSSRTQPIKPKPATDNIPKVNKADAYDAANPPIQKEIANAFHDNLRADHMKYLLEKRGLKLKTINDYNIGYDPSWYAGKDKETGQHTNGRFSIPVQNRNGQYRNIRGYSHRALPAYKMVNFTQFRGTANEKKHGSPPRLFNINRLVSQKWDHVIITEGEFDCILLNQELEQAGFTSWGAVTGTHGVKTFEPEWMDDLQGKFVYLCLDCDDEGKLGASNVASKHFLPLIQAGKFSGVRIITLPIAGTKEDKDITDYFIKDNFTIHDFIKLCLEAQELVSGGMCNDEATTEAIEVDDFVRAIKDRNYIDKRIRVPITISGTTSRIYHAIRSYKVVKCPLDKDGECCCKDAGEQFIPYGHPAFIRACMASQDQVLRYIAQITCKNDEKPRIMPMEKVVMEECFAHQVITRWRAEEDSGGRLRNSQELVVTPIYLLQPPENISIEPADYMATGFVRTHPVTSIVTMFVEELVPIAADWKKFTVVSGEAPNAEENAAVIRNIQANFTTDEILKQLTDNVTRIYDSDDILLAVLLTFLSPICIFFNGRILRGWLNTAIIGDSGTGKSATYTRLSDWLDLGDIFSALSGTRTGLLYAIKQRQGEWHVQTGRYVSASGKIIAIDETQETSEEEIKKMAIAMDTGFLSVEQVASGGYHTQTRTIFMLNPKTKEGKAATISDFGCGCESLRTSFAPMFIRRLDLAVFVTGRHDYEFYNKRVVTVAPSNVQVSPVQAEQESAKEVDGVVPNQQVINTVNQEAPANELTPNMMRSLIYWAWTRSPQQVIWSDEATDTCLAKATELSGIFGYAESIPLVNPQDFRENLARITVAYSILDRNFTPDVNCVMVEARHVMAASNLIQMIYSSPSCNLSHVSKISRLKVDLSDFDKIRDNFEAAIKQASYSPSLSYRNANHFCQMLLLMESMEFTKKRDLVEQLGVSQRWLQSRVAILIGYHMIQLGPQGYSRTRKFNLFMLRWREDEKISQMLDNLHARLGETALNSDVSREWAGAVEDTEEERVFEAAGSKAVTDADLFDSPFN